MIRDLNYYTSVKDFCGKRRLTNKEKVNGELACRGLSKKALEAYDLTDLDVYEIETDYDEETGETTDWRYIVVDGKIPWDVFFTFKGLNEFFEDERDRQLESEEDDE